MIELRAFGPPEVIADGVEVWLPPDPLALLSYLAISAPASGTGQSRQTLLGLLGSDENAPSARRTLTRALQALREALGEAAIVAPDDDTVAVGDGVACDVVAFDQAIRRQAFERAVALYRGPLLEGVHLPARATFMRWLDGERRQRDRGYDDAVVALATAEARAGRYGAAAQWWERLATHRPYSARAALGFMQALAEAGDRDRAVHHAELYVVRLRQDLDVTPSPDVLAYADELQRDPASGDTGTSARDVVASPRDEPTKPVTQSELEPGSRIGRYKLLRPVGEGGMGVVYEAEQTSPITRRVALKVIKIGMDTKEVVARFDAERQALAVMDHPNIAQVLDGGSTTDGRPYFVMELVRGIPLTEYCDNHKLTARQRLELFLPVCRAVHHAHQKGLIHRDLKPSNVLVATEEARPHPKIIDFGIAKAVGPRLTDQTLVTEFGELMGTPGYMSPEQAGLSGWDVDTRSDIYSLGVMLYELLAGALPFDFRGVRAGGLAVLHALHETDPPTPSRRFDSLGDQRGFVAERRRTDPNGLRRQLRGDLDWIVMKAMAKERPRRYDSAAALATDIHHHLSHRVVAARPPSVRYRTSRFVRRHWAGVGAATVGVVALLAGAGLAAAGWREARVEQETAQREAAKAEQVTEFLMGLFESSNPNEARGDTLTAFDLLQRGTERAEELSDQPEIQAQMLDVVGRVYRGMAEYERAQTLLERALTVRRQALGDDAPDVATSMQELALLHLRTRDYEAAEPLIREALAVQRAELGEEHLDVSQSLNLLGTLLQETDQREAAEPVFREALAMRRRLLGPDDERVTTSMNNLALLLFQLGKSEDAAPLFREVLALDSVQLEPDHPYFATDMSNLAHLLRSQGDYAEAEALYREALRIRRKVLPPDHPQVSFSQEGLALTLQALGRYEEAEALYREALTHVTARNGDEHPSVIMSLSNVASVLAEQGNYDEAEELSRQVLRQSRAAMGSEHPWIVSGLRSLAYVLIQRGGWDAADSMLTEALAMQRRISGEDNLGVFRILHAQGVLLQRRGDFTAAEPLLRRALEGLEAQVGSHPAVAPVMKDLARSALAAQRAAEADSLLRRVLAIERDALPESHWAVAETQSLLGEGLTALGRYGEAESLLVNGYERLRETRGSDDRATRAALRRLVAHFEASGETDRIAHYRAMLPR